MLMLTRAGSGSRGCGRTESPPPTEHGARETGCGHCSPELRTSGGTGRSSKAGRITPSHFSHTMHTHTHTHTPEGTLGTALQRGTARRKRGRTASPRLSGRSPLRALRAGLSFLRQGHLRISRAETRTKNTACDRQWEAFQSNEMKLPETACYGRINNRPWDRAGVGSNPSSSTYLTSNGYLATQSPHPLACERRVPPPQCSGKLLALSPARSQPLPRPLPQVLVGGKVNK